LWLKAVTGGAVTKRGVDEHRSRSLAGFDPLAEDEVDDIDTALESERTDKSH
jgi:hypothetical protein